MQKIFVIFSVLCFMWITNPVDAKTIKMIATTLNDFSTISKTENLEVELLGTKKVTDGQYIPAGTILSGNIIRFVEAKRGKRDAYAYLKINSYKLGNETEYKQVKNPNAIVKISKYQKLDLKDKGLDLGTTAAGLFVENIGYPINFVRGAIEAPKGENRLKSGAIKTYEKSFFSYASKGKELVVPKGSQLTVSFTFESDGKKND